MRFSSLGMKPCITAFNSIIQLLFLWLSDVFLEASCADLECCLLQSCCGLLMHQEAESSCLPGLACWLVWRELFLGRFKQVTTHPAQGVCDRSWDGSIRVQSGQSMSSLAYLVSMGEELLTAVQYPCGNTHPRIATQMESLVSEASTVYSTPPKATRLLQLGENYKQMGCKRTSLSSQVRV